eukprot:15462819-Alexandrium_andersonii.AAC.1
MSDPSSAAVPLSEAMLHFVDAVGRGNRVNGSVHVKTSAMRTACGAKQRAQLTLRLISREEGRAHSEGPPMRGTVLEASLWRPAGAAQSECQCGQQLARPEARSGVGLPAECTCAPGGPEARPWRRPRARVCTLPAEVSPRKASRPTMGGHPLS